MLTSFFNKSNPINYLISGILILIGYVFAVLVFNTEAFTVLIVLEHLFFLGVCIFMMLLLDFIIRKNDLNRQNTYGIILFSAFLLFVPQVFLDHTLLLSNLFLLFALRRILSLHSEKNTEKKILDASIWIGLASLFYFYLLLFYFVLYYATSNHSNKNYRYYVIPVIGFFGVFILANTYHILIDGSFLWLLRWKETIGLDFSVYNSAALLIPAAVLGTLIIWTSVNRLLKLKTVSRKERPNYFLMLLVIGICLLLLIATKNKTGAEIIFLLGPLSIVTAAYLERVEEFFFKEIVLWLILLTPVTFLFFSLQA